MAFKVLQKSKKSRARLGVIKTPNGVLHTPAFFPVATLANLKTLDSTDLKNLGLEGVLCNTYHLMLKPGSKIVQKMGGLHKFMNFKGIIATDSGGFQVFSLGSGLEHGVGKIAKIFPGQAKAEKTANWKELSSFFEGRGRKKSLLKIREEGVYFQNHLSGEELFLSPEKSIQTQQELGADIIFAFDECTSPLHDKDYTKLAMERTHRWATRCLQQQQMAKSKEQMAKQMLFGIVQGGEYKDLREKSAEFIGSLDFDGFGIGGSLGKTKNTMHQILDWTIPPLPEDKPRHLLGIGHLEDFEKAIKKGVDLFDCVYPTRVARHGLAILSKTQSINLQKSSFLQDKNPLLKGCLCPTCQNYSRAYICHLIRAKEITGMRLLTLHNLWFFQQFLANIRDKLAQGTL
ncbi:MAG: tRNA guanosine(34) transglycosylase Tgt [bacterium]|nr:tRNA guanosine(34) transglycosylase Tgt [bacterium]